MAADINADPINFLTKTEREVMGASVAKMRKRVQ